MTDIFNGNEPVIAYRTWKMEDGLLHAVGVKATWPQGVRFEAACGGAHTWSAYYASQVYGNCRMADPGHSLHLEAAPLSSCACGIYGFKDLQLVVDHLRPSPFLVAASSSKSFIPPPSDNFSRIAGRVALWGNIIECERGYRAQYAYPQTLFYTQDNEADVRAMSQVYRVDAIPMSADLAAELAKPIPDPYAELRKTLGVSALPDSFTRLHEVSMKPTKPLDLIAWLLGAKK